MRRDCNQTAICEAGIRSPAVCAQAVGVWHPMVADLCAGLRLGSLPIFFFFLRVVSGFVSAYFCMRIKMPSNCSLVYYTHTLDLSYSFHGIL